MHVFILLFNYWLQNGSYSNPYIKDLYRINLTSNTQFNITNDHQSKLFLDVHESSSYAIHTRHLDTRTFYPPKKKKCNHFEENLEVYDMQFVQIAKALYQNGILIN